jgi:hypothetical protein
MLPVQAAALVDPPARGSRLLLRDTAGATIFDIALAAGPEWKATGPRSWRYRTTRGGSAGITRVALRVSQSTGLLTVRVAGRNATYPRDGARKPLVFTLVLDPPAAATGLCAEQTAWSRGCTVASSGSSAFCR